MAVAVSATNLPVHPKFGEGESCGTRSVYLRTLPAHLGSALPYSGSTRHKAAMAQPPPLRYSHPQALSRPTVPAPCTRSQLWSHRGSAALQQMQEHLVLLREMPQGALVHNAACGGDTSQRAP